MPPLHLFFLLLLVFILSVFTPGTGATFLLEKPEIFPDEEELVLDVGKPLNLTCRAAYPVAWCSDYNFTEDHYEEIYLPGHDKPYISVLTIDAVNTSHVGYFSCVFNTTENKESINCNVNDPSISSLYLYVKDMNHLMVEIRNGMVIHAMVGETINIPCKPTFPQVNITLCRNYETYICEENKLCTYDPREGFAITMTKFRDFFECVGSYDSYYTDYYGVHFNGIDPSSKKPSPPNVEVEGYWQETATDEGVKYYVREGSSFNLTCTYHYQEESSSVKIKWKTNSLNESGTHIIIRDITSTSNSKTRYYQIKDATLQDSGIYECYATLHKMNSEPAPVEISVVGKDRTYLETSIFHPNVTEADDNLPIQWEILFTAHPEPIFRWKKGDELLRESTTDTSRNQYRNYEMSVNLKESSVSLYLHHPTLGDNGRYTLEAFINGTNITRVTTMYLMLSGMPQNVLLKSPTNDQMFREGKTFSLICTAEGYPKPRLSLLFTPYNGAEEESPVYNQMKEVPGKAMDDGGNIVKQETIWMGEAQTPGHYQCVAVNELGVDSSSSKLFLITDDDSSLAISLKLEIDGKEENLMGKTINVVEKDDFKLTCRANKMLAKAPLTWTLNDGPLTTATMEKWGFEITANDTRLSLVSSLRTRSLKRIQNQFSVKCMDKTGNSTSLRVNILEMVKPTWKVKYPGRNHEKFKNENLTLSCPVYGTPRPSIVWKKEGKPIKGNNRIKIKDNYELFIDFLLPNDHGRYTCEITNRAGNLSAPFNVNVNDPDMQRTTIILAVVGVLITALVVMSAIFCRKIYQARKETLNLQLQEQKMFMEGDPSSLNPDIPLEQQAELLPYNTKYEVTRDSIIFDKLLGSGAFGRVYRATALNLQPGEAHTTVAVKMIKSRTDCAQLKALRSEVKIMIHIGRHINIVNLLGACSKDLASKGELLLLVEYCKYGNILDHMRRHRREFVNQINDEDKIDPMIREPRPRHRSDSSSRSQTSRGLKYAHLSFHQDNVFYGTDQTSNGPSGTSSSHLSPGVAGGEDGHRLFRARTLSASSNNQQLASDNSFIPSETSVGTPDGYTSPGSLNYPQPPLCSTDLLEWAYQIAKGMEYLAFKKVLHGDLAARNVLLASNNVVKISDFGLAKDIYKNDNYRRKTNGPVPVKWLAVECLRDGVFSTQSDVWSFGVVLWEIFSLGQVPYSCSEFNESFILKLEKGVRLEQPRYSTYCLYRLMLECWNNDPMERPTFTSLENSLGEMISETQRQNYLQLTETYQDYGSSEFLDLLPSQDYSAKVRQTTPQLTEDGYEMPFSPTAPPQLMVHSDRFSKPSRLTSRQMEYLRSSGDEDSSSPYVPMSADRTDDHAVFDFDKDRVQYIMGQSEKEEDGDVYLNMETTPQHSPDADTTDGVHKRQKSSPRRIILKSISSQGSQRGRHPEVKKHDSGVYSPTVLAQTNPGYMTMSSMLATDEGNYINTEASEANSRAYTNCGTNKNIKARNYMNDGQCSAEYANLLPKTRTESDTSSGLGSVEGESPPRVIEIDRFDVSPIPEESIVV